MKHPMTNLEKAVVAQQQIDKIVQNGTQLQDPRQETHNRKY